MAGLAARPKPLPRLHGRVAQRQAKRSVARTSASTFSGSNAE
jgi:hypothetical protein